MPVQSWVSWARERDHAPSFEPVRPPQPRPPAEARPRKLSVTRIERWIANPYEIFARDILKLEPLKALGIEPDAALRGQIVHRALQEFSRDHPDRLPDDIEEALSRIADRHFEALGVSPVVKAFWRPAFRRFARWFAATEPARRDGVTGIMTEADGILDLNTGFSLTARADRIDIAGDGSAVIYDYKTGKLPVTSHVDELFAPQLPLEALIAEEGGFADLGQRPVSGLVYISASGRNEGGEEREAANTAPSILAQRGAGETHGARRALCRPGDALRGERRSAPAFRRIYKYDEYEHLARIKEWLTQEAEEDFG